VPVGTRDEANALTWNDVDLVHGLVHVHRSANRRTGALTTTKSDAARTVPIDPMLMPLLRAMHVEAGGRSSRGRRRKNVTHTGRREVGLSSTVHAPRQVRSVMEVGKSNLGPSAEGLSEGRQLYRLRDACQIFSNSGVRSL
jgi:integrase